MHSAQCAYVRGELVTHLLPEMSEDVYSSDATLFRFRIRAQILAQTGRSHLNWVTEIWNATLSCAFTSFIRPGYISHFGIKKVFSATLGSKILVLWKLGSRSMFPLWPIQLRLLKMFKSDQIFLCIFSTFRNTLRFQNMFSKVFVNLARFCLNLVFTFLLDWIKKKFRNL